MAVLHGGVGGRADAADGRGGWVALVNAPAEDGAGMLGACSNQAWPKKVSNMCSIPPSLFLSPSFSVSFNNKDAHAGLFRQRKGTVL